MRWDISFAPNNEILCFNKEKKQVRVKGTHSMDRRCNVNMDPDTRPIEAQMGTDEEAGTGALGVLTILSARKGRQKNISDPVWELKASRSWVCLHTWKHHRAVTHCHRVLHVSHGGGELAEVQLWAVDQRVGQVPAAAAGTHTRHLPLLAVGHHGRVVLPSGDSLDGGNTTSDDVNFFAIFVSHIETRPRIFISSIINQ